MAENSSRFKPSYDLLVVGGGINGCAVARDAAMRGLRVLLCERADLAGGTSSASTGLIHGGIRYLEQWRFRMVRECLQEREIWLRIAPYLVRAQNFVLPQCGVVSDEQRFDSPRNSPRSAWKIRAGLWLYDVLGNRKALPASRFYASESTNEFFEGLLPQYAQGFVYSDCCTDDARLVIAHALSASQHGASILTRTEFLEARPEAKHWRARLVDDKGRSLCIEARAIVNAAGAQVHICAGMLGSRLAIRRIKGSHLIVRKSLKHAFLFQNPDRRVVFALPLDEQHALVGTTESELSTKYNAHSQNSHTDFSVSADEEAYLLGSVNRFFSEIIPEKAVLARFAGVRALKISLDSAREASRDCELLYTSSPAPVLHIVGGKLTSARIQAEKCLDRLKSVFKTMAPCRTDRAPLPGSPSKERNIVPELQSDYPFLPLSVVRRLAGLYGTRAWHLLGEAAKIDDLGIEIAPAFHAREVDFLRQTEWARTPEDIIYRRGRLNLCMSDQQKHCLHRYMLGASASAKPARGGDEPTMGQRDSSQETHYGH